MDDVRKGTERRVDAEQLGTHMNVGRLAEEDEVGIVLTSDVGQVAARSAVPKIQNTNRSCWTTVKRTCRVRP
jgi:hypothetical protein